MRGESKTVEGVLFCREWRLDPRSTPPPRQDGGRGVGAVVTTNNHFTAASPLLVLPALITPTGAG